MSNCSLDTTENCTSHNQPKNQFLTRLKFVYHLPKSLGPQFPSPFVPSPTSQSPGPRTTFSQPMAVEDLSSTFLQALCVLESPHLQVRTSPSPHCTTFSHRRTGTFGLGGQWLSCPKNLRNSRMRDCWNQDTNALKLQDKQNRTQLPHLLKPCGRRFLWEFNFADFGFFRFREKNFREFHVQYFKVTKNGSHLVVFVTLFATNNYCIEVQQCKKARSKFLRDFCWREFVFTGFYCAFQ